MLLIADTNILIAALLKHSTTHHMIFSIDFDLYSPEHCKGEMIKYENELAKKMKKEVSDVRNAIELILSNVNIVPKDEYLVKEEEAKKICVTHTNDWPFVALALKMNAPVWTNDKAFFKHPEIKVLSTEDLIRILNK